MNCNNRTVFIGDNLPILRGLNSGIADLIATDPPWNKEQRFNHPFGTNTKDKKGKEKPGFDDAWTLDDVKGAEHDLLNSQHPDIYHLCSLARKMHSEGMMAYLVMMSSRMLECHRILKETGTLYFHCDHTANAYLRMLLDAIFGKENFRNEIVWQRSYRSDGKHWGNTADHILFYSKSDNYTWHDQFAPMSDEEIAALTDKNTSLTGAGITEGGGESGQPWKGHDPGEYGRHWSVPLTGKFAKWVEENRIADYRLIKGVHARLEALEEAGLIHWTKNGTPQVIQPKASRKGAKINCMFTDVPFVRGNEKTNWKTQKPVALYSRFILASSNPGEVVLDPFCGCSTTLVAAENAQRQWIGIDRDETAEQMVLGQLGKLAGQTPEFWRKQVIIRKCFDQHNEWPVRDDLGKIPHYKKHFEKLYTDQAGICPGCNWHRDAHVMTVDHDYPRSKGGRDNIENLRVLCSGCNSAKGTKTLAQLIARNKKKGVWNFGLYGREQPIDLTEPPHPNPSIKKPTRGVSKKQKSLRLK